MGPPSLGEKKFSRSRNDICFVGIKKQEAKCFLLSYYAFILFIIIEEYKPEKNTRHNLYVLGAWLRLCQIKSEEHRLDASFSHENIDSLVNEITNIMKSGKPETNDTLHTSFLKYGIDYSILKPFKSAPVQGFISSKADGTYQMVVSESDSSSKSFWTNVFHELGHIVNGDIRKNTSFIDNGCNPDIDRKADEFAKSIIG